MPSPTSSRRNLAKVQRERSAEETGIIKRLVWQWALQPEDKRQSQQELARELRVSRQYINKVAKRVVLDAPRDLQPVTLTDLKGATDRRRFYTPAPVPAFETREADEQTAYREQPVMGMPQYNQPRSQPQHSNFSPYTKPQTYREWEQQGLLDGPRRNHHRGWNRLRRPIPRLLGWSSNGC